VTVHTKIALRSENITAVNMKFTNVTTLEATWCHIPEDSVPFCRKCCHNAVTMEVSSVQFIFGVILCISQIKYAIVTIKQDIS
jgi:hypothetical protein